MVVAAVAVGAYVLVHLNDEIQGEVQRLLAEHYQHLEVRVGGARLVEGRGIEIRRLSFRDRSASPDAPPLVEIDEVFLACPVQTSALLHGLPPLTHVVFHRPHFRVMRKSDGRWNLERLLPLPKAGKQPAEVLVRQGTVELVADAADPRATITLREITGRFRRTGGPRSAADASPGEIVFAATATTPLCRQVTLGGRIDPDRGALRLRGRLGELTLTEEILARLPAPLAGAMQGLKQLRGSIEVENLEIRQTDGAAPDVVFAASLEQVAIEHERLPDPLAGLMGKITYQEGVLHVPHLAGTCGSAGLELSLRRHGWDERAPFAVSARLTGFELGERHWVALPEIVRTVWEKYRPEGLIDVARCDLTYDGRRLRPHVEVHCHDVSLLCEKFRYPLAHVRGVATIDAVDEPRAEVADVRVRLTGEATARQPVTIEGEFAVDTGPAGLRGHPVGSLRIAGTGIVVDEPLVAALPHGPQRFVRDLRAAGRFDVVWQSWRTDPTVAESEKRLDMTLRGGSVRYERFPYPLQIVGGRAESQNGHWQFIDLTATSGEATVLCNGSLRPPGVGSGLNDAGGASGTTAAGALLTLDFHASRLELDSTLRNALATLTADAQRAWEMLDPAGRVNASVSYRHVLGSGSPYIEHVVEPIDQSVSIKPQFFPYRVEQLEGKIHFGPTSARFERMRGRHGPTTIVADGTFQKLGTDGWSLELANLSVDRLVVEQDMQSALPEGLARVVARLNPRGQISLGDSHVHLSRTAPGDPLTTSWRLNFDLHQASLDCGVRLENLSGGIKLAGHGRGDEFTTDGELDLDSVLWKGFFASHVSGPLYVDGTQVLLGSHASLARNIPPRRITAEAYGGKLTGDAMATLGPKPQFSVAAEFQAGDLRRLISETWPTREHVQGEIYGRLNLEGMAAAPETFRGAGAVALRNAELYELPQLIRLFKVLRGHEPDRTAFTRADAQFKISGRLLIFQNLELTGDALALHGGGTIDFDQRLNLAFFSELAPSDAPLLRSFMRQASKQVARMHVQGTIANPSFHHEPLPMLSEGLQQFQQELGSQARGPAAQGAEPRGARNWLGPLWR